MLQNPAAVELQDGTVPTASAESGNQDTRYVIFIVQYIYNRYEPSVHSCNLIDDELSLEGKSMKLICRAWGSSSVEAAFFFPFKILETVTIVWEYCYSALAWCYNDIVDPIIHEKYITI